MALPGRSLAYADQSSSEVLDPISFALDDGNWTNSPTSFEVDALPPGFTTDGQALGGVAGCKMLYVLFVRGVNDEGAGDFFPLEWTVSTASGTLRTLYGLPIEWPSVAQNPAAVSSTVFIHRAGVGGAQNSSISGSMLLSDIPDVDGTASLYTSEFLRTQIILSGATDTFFRATAPGWEIFIDTGG